MPKTFSEKIKECRTERRLTLEYVANAVGSTKAYIWELENKKNARPSGQLLLRLADCLQVAPDFLIDESAEEETDDHTETAFFRRFSLLSDNDKATLQKIAKSLEPKK